MAHVTITSEENVKVKSAHVTRIYFFTPEIRNVSKLVFRNMQNSVYRCYLILQCTCYLSYVLSGRSLFPTWRKKQTFANDKLFPTVSWCIQFRWGYLRLSKNKQDFLFENLTLFGLCQQQYTHHTIQNMEVTIIFTIRTVTTNTHNVW